MNLSKLAGVAADQIRAIPPSLRYGATGARLRSSLKATTRQVAISGRIFIVCHPGRRARRLALALG